MIATSPAGADLAVALGAPVAAVTGAGGDRFDPIIPVIEPEDLAAGIAALLGSATRSSPAMRCAASTRPSTSWRSGCPEPRDPHRHDPRIGAGRVGARHPPAAPRGRTDVARGGDLPPPGRARPSPRLPRASNREARPRRVPAVAAAPNVIRFPEVAAPDVTVVVVTFNRWDLTRQALSLLVELTEPRYEVVVVDNASTDGTADRARPGGRRIDPAQPAQSRVRAGVQPGGCDGPRAPPRCSSTATPGCDRGGSTRCSRLPTRIPASPRWRPGSSTPTGASRRPVRSSGAMPGFATTATATSRTRPEYLFRRTVDYASAACLLVKRSAFVAVGGFDPRFAPVYCEDVDLCLAPRHRSGTRRLSAPLGRRARARRVEPRRLPAIADRAQPPPPPRALAIGARPPPAGEPAGGAERAHRRARRDDVRAGADPHRDRDPTRTDRRSSGASTISSSGAVRRWPDARWTVASLDGDAGDAAGRAR